MFNESKKHKQQNIYNLLAGQAMAPRYDDKYAGRAVVIKHNLKFINGPDDELFSCYKHLDAINYIIKQRYLYKPQYNIIEPGEVIGRMGNTGYCLTKENRKWRELTKKEKKDKKCTLGVHTHIEFYQNTLDDRITPLIQELLNNNRIKKEPQYYFFRHNRLYINPDIIISYVKLLQGRNPNG
jgi:hypothetical protein